MELIFQYKFPELIDRSFLDLKLLLFFISFKVEHFLLYFASPFGSLNLFRHQSVDKLRYQSADRIVVQIVVSS